MRRNCKQIGLLLLGLLLGSTGLVRGQTIFSGSIGLDLENYRFHNALADTSRDFSVNRSLSSHFLDLRLSTPVVTEQFASFTGRAMVFGTYYQVSGTEGEVDEYFRPQLPTYSAALSLFPTRPYPLRLYYDKARVHSVRYEANNRSKVQQKNPELAIVRRYQSDLNARGGMWKIAFSENVNLTTEVKREGVTITRGYDFGENKNIWVSFSTVRPDSLNEVDTIKVVNTITTDTVLLFVDFVFVDSVLPGATVSFPLDSGYHDVEFFPLKLNSFRTRDVSVRGDMIWKILPTPPATPNDLRQRMNAATGVLRIGGNGRLVSETFYEYTDTDEDLQNMITYLSNFAHTGSYEFSRTSRLRTLTSYNQNQTEIFDISSQLNKAFMHQTSLNWGSSRGLANTLTHSITKMSSKTDVDDFSSNTHILGTRSVYPISQLNYTLDLKNAVSLLSDNRGYANDQYSTDLTNSFEFFLGRTKWQPKSQVKYSYNIQRNPGKKARELETRYMLDGEFPNVIGLGALKIRSEYGRRKRTHDDGFQVKNRYFVDVGLVKKYDRRYKITLLTSQEKETYGGSTPTAGANPNQRNPARQPIVKELYKIDVQAAPWASLNISGSVLLIRQGTTQITRYGVSMITTVPKLNIPIRSFLTTEVRDLVGIPRQSNLSMETKASYRFRQITITLHHYLIRENLPTERYRYQEILIKVARQFSIL